MAYKLEVYSSYYSIFFKEKGIFSHWRYLGLGANPEDVMEVVKKHQEMMKYKEEFDRGHR
jgi:hypothetical protein